MKWVAAFLAAGLIGMSGNTDDMVFVKGGPAELGAPDRNSLNGPAIYQIDSFYIDRHEVTNAEYKEFVKATGHEPSAFADDGDFNRDNQPVTGVTWDDANSYCKWAGKRLPGEAEWEKAARSGDGRLYPWGNRFNAGFAYLSGEAPIELADYPPEDVTPDGITGMAGGVSEWVRDVQIASGGVCGRGMSYQPGYVSNDRSVFETLLKGGGNLTTFAPACTVGEQKISPQVVAKNQQLSRQLAMIGRKDWGMQKCAHIKGNSFNGLEHMTKLTNRMWDYTDSYAEFVGFRCAKSAN